MERCVICGQPGVAVVITRAKCEDRLDDRLITGCEYDYVCAEHKNVTWMELGRRISQQFTQENAKNGDRLDA